jgi:hypothetical protein
MLRARSGERQTPNPSAVDETALTEIGQVVAHAQAEISRLVQLGELQNDPIRHPIQALSVHLDALYRITVAGSQTLAKQIQTADAPKLPMPDTDLRQAVAQGIRASAGHLLQALNARNVLVAAGMLLITLLIGAGGGYWFGRTAYLQVPAQLGIALDGPDASQWVNLIRLNDIAKANRTCATQAGGVACSISLWTKPPTAQQ